MTAGIAPLLTIVAAVTASQARQIRLKKSPHAGSVRATEMRRSVGMARTINDRPLTNGRCVSDSGELATRSSKNFGSIESGLRMVPPFSKLNEDGNAQTSRVDECQTPAGSGAGAGSGWMAGGKPLTGVAPRTHVKIQISAQGSGKLVV